jgi:Protein of unknown function (DUF2735)
MNANLNRGSARIYQFPAGGRSALGAPRQGEAETLADPAAERVNVALCSGSWYHEAAIQESRQTKPARER